MDHNDNLKNGDVIWQMHGRRKNDEIKWDAVPKCITEIKEHMFMFSDGGGIIKKAVGITVFMTREECLRDFLGRHNGLTEKVDIDKPVSSSIAEYVTEYPRTDFEDKVIICNDGITGTLIFAETECIPIERFQWKIREYKTVNQYEYLTLHEIREQFDDMKYGNKKRILTVVSEEPMEGYIYQSGNHKGNK